MSSSAKNSIPSSYGIILLAAGASSRLGKPKQLLTYNDKTLLQHSLQIAIATEIESIVTVLGANSDLLSESLSVFDLLDKENMYKRFNPQVLFLFLQYTRE